MDSWSSQASDPRDKIFTLLGVITGAAADGLIADYSLSVEQVYTGLVAFALTKQGEVNILRYASGYAKSRNLPSWVPDWRLLSRDWGIMLRMEHIELGVRRTSSSPPGAKEYLRWASQERPFYIRRLMLCDSFDLITLQVSDHEADIADDIAQISQWTVLHGSTDSLGGLRTENTQAMYLKLAETCSAAHMQYSAWQITFLKNLRDRINLVWDDVLHRFKKEPFALTDASAPYHWRTPILLPDLIKAFGGQSDFWSMIIGQLITASMSSDEETKEKIRQERRRLQALRKNMSLLSVTCKATETETALNARISEELDLLARDRLLYIQQLHTRRQREGDRYCPRWYDFAGISFYWYNMRHIHGDKAADYIEQALAYMDIAHTENSITAASVLRANIDAATEYRRATRIASMEVKLTAKSLELPMLETDPEEKMDDWQNIFII
ncbi:hypothetical protein SMACR_04080 [Sordaria macrospora]|nr:hypothetical protein SMACR_04080 [Sordaria macrospora]WPJ64360.1 hypothetical protein SMAC4_04080 [Sordaria macrospora]